MVEAVFRVFVAGKDEVQDADGVNAVQVEVPLVAHFSLLDDGESGIEHAAVLEEILAGLLHLNNEFFAVFALAIYIEDGAALTVGGHFLGGQIAQILHHLLRLAR